MMDIFDIYIAYASWSGGGKKRPVLILEQGSKSVTAFSITTQYQNKSEIIRGKFYEIGEWRQAGLDKPSYVDTNNTVTLPLSSVDVINPVGRLTDIDVINLIEFLA